VNEVTTVVLKTDQVLGLFACVDEAAAEDLRECLIESGVRFALDSERAARLAEPGKRTFVFGWQDPHGVRDVIMDYGWEVQVHPGVILTEKTYRPPLDQLLSLGEPRRSARSASCPALGIRREHVPELIRMATDEKLHTGPAGSPIPWAPVHAWWALAELRAEEAIVPLLGLLRRVDEKDDDWVAEDLPRVFAAIGPAAIQPLTDYLANPSHGEWARVAAARSLSLVAQSHPHTREECVTRLSAQLERFAEQSETFNAFLISPLLDLRAVEAAPVMERAFASGRVDETVQGDWEDAQIDLGLKTEREHPRKPNKFTMLGDRLRAAWAAAQPRETESPYIAPRKVGRNDPCPCGSGRKYKKCCGR